MTKRRRHIFCRDSSTNHKGEGHGIKKIGITWDVIIEKGDKVGQRKEAEQGEWTLYVES